MRLVLFHLVVLVVEIDELLINLVELVVLILSQLVLVQLLFLANRIAACYRIAARYRLRTEVVFARLLLPARHNTCLSVAILVVRDVVMRSPQPACPTYTDARSFFAPRLMRLRVLNANIRFLNRTASGVISISSSSSIYSNADSSVNTRGGSSTM